jgi:glucoamylase
MCVRRRVIASQDTHGPRGCISVRAMRIRRSLGAAVLAASILLAALLLVSGDDRSDPRTPAALPGLPPPFLGVAVLGDGGMTAAVDAYGNVVDLRARGPAGRALIENPAERQAGGTVPSDTGIQVWARVDGEMLPMWRADEVRQRYLPGTNVLRTVARFGSQRVQVEEAIWRDQLAVVADGAGVRLRAYEADGFVSTSPEILAKAAASDRRWLGRALPLGASAPPWAVNMYERSLLVLRALTARENGAVAAGARDGWAYVWPRDASAVAIALAKSGFQPEAELIVQFLLGAGVEFAARFNGDGSPVPGREAQGDAIGWVAAAAEAAGVGNARQAAHILAGGEPVPWRDRADYWEGEPGDYLGNALASGADVSEFKGLYDPPSSDTPSRWGLVREAGHAYSGLDSAAAWAVRPFSQPRLYPAARRTMKRLVAAGTPFGITPGEGWEGGEDPWSAPTAWTAWSLAALGERQPALRLMQALRRSATPAGTIPERVDAQTGVPRSTTPLAWSHAFAILALRELWPS